MLCQRNAKNISSEDLNHAIAIFGKRDRVRVPPLESRDLTPVGNAVIICISREIERSKPKPKEEMSDFTEAQLLEAEMQARHNCEALENGIGLMRDRACMEEGQLSTRFLTQALRVVKDLVHMFQGFTHTQNQNEDEDVVPVFICGNNCQSAVQCVHYRVARDGLDISEAISTRLDVQILRKFIANRTRVHAAPSS